jgi:hypothetical protein
MSGELESVHLPAELLDEARDAVRRGSVGSVADYAMYREWGRWTIRPVTGWRSHRWITPPTHATRAIAHDDHDTASDWAADLLSIPR